MSACSALQSISYLEHMESAATNPRLQVAMDPTIVYGLNQQFLFGSLLSKEWLDRAVQQLKASGVADDFEKLKAAAAAAGLRLTETELARVKELQRVLEANGWQAKVALENVSLEDGQGLPAIAILVLVVVVIVAVWVEIVI